MAGELSEKLRNTFQFSENHIEAVMYDLRRTCTQVRITGALHVVTADPDDDKFVECAVVAGAKLIVSGDGHLLKLGQHGDVQIDQRFSVPRTHEVSIAMFDVAQFSDPPANVTRYFIPPSKAHLVPIHRLKRETLL